MSSDVIFSEGSHLYRSSDVIFQTNALSLENHLHLLPLFYLPRGALTKTLTGISLKSSGAPEQIICGNSKSEAELMYNGCMSTSSRIEHLIYSV